MLQHFQNIQGTGCTVNRISPYQTLLTMPPSGAIGCESFIPESLFIIGLRHIAQTLFRNFRHNVHHRNRVHQHSRLQQRTVSQCISSYPPHMMTKTRNTDHILVRFIIAQRLCPRLHSKVFEHPVRLSLQRRTFSVLFCLLHRLYQQIINTAGRLRNGKAGSMEPIIRPAVLFDSTIASVR